MWDRLGTHFEKHLSIYFGIQWFVDINDMSLIWPPKFVIFASVSGTIKCNVIFFRRIDAKYSFHLFIWYLCTHETSTAWQQAVLC